MNRYVGNRTKPTAVKGLAKSSIFSLIGMLRISRNRCASDAEREYFTCYSKMANAKVQCIYLKINYMVDLPCLWECNDANIDYISKQ